VAAELRRRAAAVAAKPTPRNSLSVMAQFNLATLVLRLTLGLFLAMHGYNKIFGGGRLTGTAAWFGSIGMKWPALQARLAAGTEIGAGLLLAAGLLTPFAAAGIIAVMVVAIVVAHRTNGFFIFNKDQGWEYCATIALAAFAVATVGAGEWSVDHAADLQWTGWQGALIAGLMGVGGALAQLLVSYRPAS
jgi:putative oxidoreductase